MYNFSGCPCSVCGKPFTDTDDIVVCPDCGAPYHRSCYEKLGVCVNAPKHAAGFEWTPPAAAHSERRCPNCGTPNPEDAARCGQCGCPLEPAHSAQAGPAPSARPGAARQAQQPPAGNAGGFNYARMYQDAQGGVWQSSPFGADAGSEPIDGISCAEWSTYLGPSSTAYLRDFSQMQKYDRKTSISFSALLFGPFYFFYRKAWKPAFAFLAVDILLELPALLELLILTDSAIAPAISSSTLLFAAQLASIASFAVMVVRGMFAKYLYRKSASRRIRRIQTEFPDAGKRQAVLRAQGGVSWAAVVGIFTVLSVLCAVFSLFLGPNLDAVTSLLL